MRNALSSLLVLVLLALPGAAAAAPPPDLVVVIGHDPELVLPATLLAHRSGAPLLLVDPDRPELAAAFIARLKARAPRLFATPDSSRAEPGIVAKMLGLPATLAPEPAAASIEPGTTGYLVERGDLEAALAATHAAGRTGGFVGFVAPGKPAASHPAFLPTSTVVVGRLARRTAPFLDSQAERLVVDPASLLATLPSDPRAMGQRRLVLANPEDTRGHFSPPHLSLLAPLVALQQGAELHLVDADPATTAALARPPAGSKTPVADTVTLVADILGIEQREIDDPDDRHQGRKRVRRFALPNLVGLGPTTTDDPEAIAPAEIAVGRLAALDVHDLSLQLARQRASEGGRWPRSGRALMMANVDLKFRLGEAISRASVKELEAAGFRVDAHYGPAVEEARKAGALAGHDLIVWEGHPRDLGVDGHLGLRDELLDARLVVLQGCYTLERNDAYVLGALGAESVLGTSMPVYSASGSALAKVFLDAQLQQGIGAGEALVHARNYTLAYLRLKAKRGQDEWRKTWRAALAFDLWGDPTTRPLARAGEDHPPAIRLERQGDRLSFVLPPERHPEVETEAYSVSIHPGGQLGSLIGKLRSDPEGPRRVQEVYFGWVSLPEQATPPRLETGLDDRDWAMVWAPARRRLYLLVHSDAQAAPSFRLLR
ncbi:MAG: hypothetical protein P1V51_14935 [Deltaproteobacteria bacterium]|nr:hypothetical protein [Deltaproteobacteria bacterium]